MSGGGGGGGGGWAGITYRPTGIFRPTAAVRLPSGAILVLERALSFGFDLTARLVLLQASAIAPGARLGGTEVAVLRYPLVVDNMGGLASRQNVAGQTLIYLISDDNFSALQRTLLLMFELRGG